MFGSYSFRGVLSPIPSLEKKGGEPVRRSLNGMVDIRFRLIDIFSPAVMGKLSTLKKGEEPVHRCLNDMVYKAT
jgi:hypothetical protein